MKTHTNRDGGDVLPDLAAAPADGIRVAASHLLRSESHQAGMRPMLPAQ